ncbi:hypothetical protein ACFY2T_41400 [Streptomyces sp. NPDC001260]|uniref:hypothetical protein n=1 Tax=Streptomyces sp. NPDC001260 TaxID=3364551 RepID=UPI00369B31DF
MAATLKELEGSKTPPKARTTLANIVAPVIVTLKVMEDPKTPPEMRGALMMVVEPTTITLKIIENPETPPHDRATTEACAHQLIAILKVIHNPKTSSEHRDTIEGIVDPVTVSIKILENGKTPRKYRNTVENVLHPETAALKIAADPRMPLPYQNGARHAVAPLTAPLKEMQNPKTSEQRRAAIDKRVKQRTTDLNKTMRHLKELTDQFTDMVKAMWALVDADNSVCEVRKCVPNWSSSNVYKSISRLSKITAAIDVAKVVALYGNLKSEQTDFDKTLAKFGANSKEAKVAAARLDSAKIKLHGAVIDAFSPIAIFWPLPAE